MILASDAVEKYAHNIIDKCIQDILLQCHHPEEGGGEWIEDADLGIECRAKVSSLRSPLIGGPRIEDPGESATE